MCGGEVTDVMDTNWFTAKQSTMYGYKKCYSIFCIKLFIMAADLHRQVLPTYLCRRSIEVLMMEISIIYFALFALYLLHPYLCVAVAPRLHWKVFRSEIKWKTYYWKQIAIKVIFIKLTFFNSRQKSSECFWTIFLIASKRHTHSWLLMISINPTKISKKDLCQSRGPRLEGDPELLPVDRAPHRMPL